MLGNGVIFIFFTLSSNICSSAFTHIWSWVTPQSESIGFNIMLVHLLHLQLFWEGFPQDLRVLMGIFDHSYRNTVMRSDGDVGRGSLALYLCFNSSQKLSRMTSRFCEGHSSSSISNYLIHVFMDLDLWWSEICQSWEFCLLMCSVLLVNRVKAKSLFQCY